MAIHALAQSLTGFPYVPRVRASLAAPDQVDYISGVAGVYAFDLVLDLVPDDGGLAADDCAGGASGFLAGLNRVHRRLIRWVEITSYKKASEVRRLTKC